MSAASTPASSSAARAAGSAMSVSASSSAAIRRSRIPVRSRIHSSEVSTISASSSFVITFSGTWTPRPVIPIRTPCADPSISAPPRRSAFRARRARRRRAPSPCRVRSGRASCRSRRSSVRTSPGSTTRLKRQSSMPAKNAIFPRFSSSTRTAIAPVCAIASTMSTPGITGRSGKWPGNHQSSALTLRRATTRRPGSSSVTSSMRRNGSRCGRIDSITSFPNGTAGVCTGRVYWPHPASSRAGCARPGRSRSRRHPRRRRERASPALPTGCARLRCASPRAGAPGRR